MAQCILKYLKRFWLLENNMMPPPPALQQVLTRDLLPEGGGGAVRTQFLPSSPWSQGRHNSISRIFFIRAQITSVSVQLHALHIFYPECSARDWDGKDYLRIIPRVVLVEDPRLT